MAFFRNCGNEMESGNDLNEKGGDIEAEEDYISAGNNRQMDLNFAENDAEMKLDNHYEQDGEEQSDSLLGRGRRITSISGSRLPPRPVPVTENAAKSSKATKYDEYDDFEDYEESDEEEEDDPDDVDFEPDFGDTCKSIKNKEFANVNGQAHKR